MILAKGYDLWDGEKIIGKYVTTFTLRGVSLTIPEVGMLKQRYGSKPKVITVPLFLRLVYDDGVEIRHRLTLDVRKKSKRQINIILNNKDKI